jgi:uncharacterized protein (TIGR02599 family)
MNRSAFAYRSQGFTLVEVMVSSALLVFIMVLVLTTVEQTQKLWVRTSSKVTQFQSARSAFDALTRRVSQATLNTYYRAFDEDISTESAVLTYAREAELQFMSGPTAKIMTSPEISGLPPDADLAFPTHSIFFTAPLGLTSEPDTSLKGGYVPRFRNLSSALVATGYFIEYGEDPDVPDQLKQAGVIHSKKRFRLMELNVPTEKLSIYRRPLDTDRGVREYKNDPQILNVDRKEYVGLTDRNRKPTQGWVRPLWMDEALDRVKNNEGSGQSEFRFRYARSLADNIVALVVLPKVAQKDREIPTRIDDLAPNYMYDSWRVLALDPQWPQRAARYNQLPPILQISMIAIDEPSGARIADRYKDQLPDWSSDLFQQVTTEQDFRTELAKLEAKIAKDPTKPSYRVFSTDVVLRGSKWSRDANIFIIDKK